MKVFYCINVAHVYVVPIMAAIEELGGDEMIMAVKRYMTHPGLFEVIDVMKRSLII